MKNIFIDQSYSYLHASTQKICTNFCTQYYTDPCSLLSFFANANCYLSYISQFVLICARAHQQKSSALKSGRMYTQVQAYTAITTTDGEKLDILIKSCYNNILIFLVILAVYFITLQHNIRRWTLKIYRLLILVIAAAILPFLGTRCFDISSCYATDQLKAGKTFKLASW